MLDAMARSDALRILAVADRHRAKAALPTLSMQERLDKLYDLWEDDTIPADTENNDPDDMALGIYRDAIGNYRLVRAEPPDDPANPRYDKLLLQVLPGGSGYHGVTNEYLSSELARIGRPGIVVVGEPETLWPCPCCDYRTLARRGEYDTCPVCYWEDDGSSRGDQFSGPNHMTLREGRENFQLRGSKYSHTLPYAREATLKYLRAASHSCQ